MRSHLVCSSSDNGRLVGILLLCWLAGCTAQDSKVSSSVPATKVEVAPFVPAVIEIGEVKARFEPPDVARVEIPYRFTSGHPVAHYQCDIRFVDTKQGGIKSMAGWELKDEGVIKTGFNVVSPPGDKVEVVISEAESPDRGYKRISNTVVGLFAHAKEKSDGAAVEQNSAGSESTTPK